MPATSTRARNATLILIVAVAAAAVLYFLTDRSRPAKVIKQQIQTPSHANHFEVAQATELRQLTNTELPSERRSVSSPATTLDGMTIMNCHDAFLRARPIQGRENCDHLPLDTPAIHRLCERTLIEDAARIQAMAAQAASCPSSLVHASAYYDALRATAQSGDVSAQQCFITGYFELPEDTDHISQQQYNEFSSLANGYISSGLERGDWGLVRWLASPRLGTQDGLLFQAYPFGPSGLETLYKMNLLLTLGGASDAEMGYPQSIVQSFKTSGELSDQQMKEAEEWARSTYSNYFAATPYDAKAAASFCKPQ